MKAYSTYLTDSVFVVIRSSYEATENLCYYLVNKQVPATNICLVRGVRPFYNALIKSYQCAIKRGFKYTAIIDADLLVLPNMLEKLLNYFECECDSNVFALLPRMLDHFIIKSRYGGIHFYRTEYLEKMLQYVNDSSFCKELRPEAFLNSKMIQQGYLIVSVPIVTCLHEFCCSKYDIIIKNHLKVRKSSERIIERSTQRKLYAIISVRQRLINKLYKEPIGENVICDDNELLVYKLCDQMGVNKKDIKKKNLCTLYLLRSSAILYIYFIWFCTVYFFINKISNKISLR